MGLLKLDAEGETVWINPSHIAMLSVEGDNKTLITLANGVSPDNSNMIIVTGNIDRVASTVNQMTARDR